jgi:hypothetical protein
VVVFLLSVIAALYVTYAEAVPQLKMFMFALATVFTTAVAFYEVLLQYIPIFKGEKE